MNDKEFIEAILNANEETIKVVCQLLKAHQLPSEFPDLLSGNAHKASWHIH